MGNQQSPVNITDTKRGEPKQLNISYKESGLDLKKNGAMKAYLKDGGAVEFSGKRYGVVEFHFHIPSEHRFNGKESSAEVHIVHKDEEGSILVIGVLIDRGFHNNAFERVLSALEGKSDKVSPEELLPVNRTFYLYPGSLTTPPYTEGVTWIVMKEKIEVSDDQLDRLKALDPLGAREVQPLGDRVILEIEPLQK